MKTFLNDSDGLNRRDFLLIISSLVFFGFVLVGLILILLNHQIDDKYIDLLGMVSPVVMTIVGGLFGVQAVHEFRNPSRSYKDEDDSTI
jgi:uncharacterized membrane protein YraQ (UPF0718 family)